MGTLELQVGDEVVFAHFRSEKAGAVIGGSLGRVFPGGSFKGIGYAELRALGTGRHQVSVDGRAQSQGGREPKYDSEWRRLFQQFEYSLFMYGVGACTASDVLAAAREVILASQGKRAEPSEATGPAA